MSEQLYVICYCFIIQFKLHMKSQRSQSQIAEQRMIPRISFQEKKLDKKKYMTFKDVKQIECLTENSNVEHSDCKCESVEWNIMNEDAILSDIGIKVFNQRMWLIDRNLFTCCKQFVLDIKISIKRNSKFQICRVNDQPNQEQGIKYVVQGYGMTVKLSVIFVKEGQQLVWKEIELPQNTLTQQIQHHIIIKQRPDSLITVNFNTFFFSFNISQPFYPNNKICFKGSFKIHDIKLHTIENTKLDDKQPQCSLCRLF